MMCHLRFFTKEEFSIMKFSNGRCITSKTEVFKVFAKFVIKCGCEEWSVLLITLVTLWLIRIHLSSIQHQLIGSSWNLSRRLKIRAASVLQRDALLLMKAEFLFKTGASTFCQLGILFTYSFKKKTTNVILNASVSDNKIGRICQNK